MPDYSRYRYEKFENRSNVLCELDINSPYPEGVHISPRIMAVVRPLLKRAPQNTYMFVSAYANNPMAKFHRFEVWREGEKLGTISEAYVRGRMGVTIDNQRIRAARDRGNPAGTSDPAKAVSLIMANFLPQSQAEAIKAATVRAREKVSVIINQPTGVYNATFRKHGATVAATMQSAWKTVGRQIALTAGIPQIDIDQLDTLLAGVEAVAPLRDAGMNDELMCVMLRGKDYCVGMLQIDGMRSTATKPLEVFGPDDVPEALRRSLGLLKLTEPGNYVDGVGVKIDDTTFAVIIPKA